MLLKIMSLRWSGVVENYERNLLLFFFSLNMWSVIVLDLKTKSNMTGGTWLSFDWRMNIKGYTLERCRWMWQLMLKRMLLHGIISIKKKKQLSLFYIDNDFYHLL